MITVAMSDGRQPRHHAKPQLIAHAREMRHQPAPAEQQLWWKLRDRRLGGFKFRRQQPVGPFVADYYCSECNLIVELDGDTHDGREAYDARRTDWLASNGHAVVCFTNTDVHENLDGVLSALLAECQRRAVARQPSDAASPSPLAGEGRGEG
jgi:very-short-patch-repair endonuclease